MVYWRHFAIGAPETAAQALAVGQSGTFHLYPQDEQARLLRALLVLSLQAATLADLPGPLGLLGPALYEGNSERNAIGSAVARTPMLLSFKNAIVPPKDIFTWDGAPASFEFPGGSPPPIDAGDTALALPALAVVAIACAASAAVSYIATIIAQTNHAIAFEEERTKRMLGWQSNSVATIAQHVEREKLAGKLLPFSPEEKTVLKNLEKAQQQIAEERHIPLPTPFDGARSFGLALAETTKKVGDSAAEGVSLMVPALAIGAAFILTSKI